MRCSMGKSILKKQEVGLEGKMPALPNATVHRCESDSCGVGHVNPGTRRHFDEGATF
jgi:hypothetical protein